LSNKAEFKSSLQACSSDSEIYLIKIHTKIAENLPNGHLGRSMINFPEIRERDINFRGYMGHDTFKIEELWQFENQQY